ncbi:hypothetical protein EGR_10304 [Echinococcus granulosus]|uniref:Uncharacterized protein n=1 Tax=Echinococcus granulosus TaxID=6210 RepID=W6UMW2_ECHGR|nr:hypothetical protein EGR_10304 [Echinococcus granulosus]EUB54839.1 hypothetical protein EGR_10304 [Echinococcus granulosus]
MFADIQQADQRFTVLLPCCSQVIELTSDATSVVDV